MITDEKETIQKTKWYYKELFTKDDNIRRNNVEC